MNSEARFAITNRLAVASTRVLALCVGALLLASCGGSDDSASAAKATEADDRKAALATTPPASNPGDANVKGVWGPVFDWPLIPIHAVLMPDGRVMTYGSRPDGSSTAFFGVDIWDNTGEPNSGHLSLANGTGNDLFCGSQLLLPPVGNAPVPSVFMAGGDAWNGSGNTFVGINRSTVFNAAANNLVRGSNMNSPRWYSSSITLTTGETYIQGGAGGESNGG